MPSPPPALARLDALAARLPFALDDVEAANEAFLRWRADGRREDLETLDLWTYCFVRRYVLLKFTRDVRFRAPDVDALEAATFAKVREKRESIRDESRYASWVSVVCKHQFINYLRKRRPEASLPDSMPLPDPGATPTPPGHDAAVVLQALAAAILRLPPFLQTVARMRFEQEASFEQIADAIDKPIPTVRAYVSKILARFRDDHALVGFLRDEPRT